MAYAALCVIGTILPLTQFVPFTAEHGFDLVEVRDHALVNRVTAGLAWDVSVSSTALWAFMVVERRIRWALVMLVVVANVAVGLSLALPLYLLLRGQDCVAR